MIRKRIVKAVLIFYREALIFKGFLVFRDEISVRIKIMQYFSTEFFRI